MVIVLSAEMNYETSQVPQRPAHDTIARRRGIEELIPDELAPHYPLR